MPSKRKIKLKAAVLIEELASLGFTLTKSQAKGIVAKLKEAGKSSEAAAELKEPESAALQLHYIGGDFKGLDRGMSTSISAQELAGHFRHGTPESRTTLYEWVAPDGEAFRLLLCGHAEFHSCRRGQEVITSSAEGLTGEYLYLICSDEPLASVAHSPYFEWVDQAGAPVAETFWSIAPDATVEVASFAKRQALTNPHFESGLRRAAKTQLQGP
jgi:hypothetical protein